jgi:sugar phosphate isomerase/epimerase
MKLGMPILFEYETIEENLKLATELGLDFVELNLNFSYCRKEMEEGKIPELLKKYPLQITLHFYDEADLGSYPEVVEGYLKLLERYASLGEGYVRMMNFHNNGGPLVTISGKRNYVYEKEYGSYIKRLIPAYTKAKEICEKRGIKLVIENTDTCPGATFLKDVYRDEMNAGFHFNFDIGHDTVMGDWLYELSKKLPLKFDEFHIHDSDGKRNHLALGEGTLGEKLKEFKEMAKKNDAYVLLEVKSKEDLRKSVPFWRNL